MKPNYLYTDQDIEAVLRSKPALRKKNGQYDTNYQVVQDTQLPPNFFALDLLQYIRDAKGEIENRRFAVALNVSNDHWVTVAIESTGANKAKAKELCDKLKAKDDIYLKVNPQQKNFPGSEALQDQELATLVKEVYANTKVQFVDSTSATYLIDARKDQLSQALGNAFSSYELRQVNGIRQTEFPLVHCGPITCLNIESFLTTGEIAVAPEQKSYEAYITEVRQQHWSNCGDEFQARQNDQSSLSATKWASESFARLGELKAKTSAITDVVKDVKVKKEIEDFLQMSQDKLQAKNADYKLAFELQLEEINSVLKPPRP